MIPKIRFVSKMNLFEVVKNRFIMDHKYVLYMSTQLIHSGTKWKGGR